MFDVALTAAFAIAAQTRRLLLAAFRGTGTDWLRYWGKVRPVLVTADGLFAKVLRDMQLYGYATGGAGILERLVPPEQVEPPHLPTADILTGPFDPAPIGYKLTGLNAAADYLQSLNAVSAGEWQELDDDARRVSFSVSKAMTREAAADVQVVLARSVADGLTFGEVRPLLKEALQTSPVGEGYVENIYRTYYGKAQAAGQLHVLDNPMVRDEFPYVKYSATHDDRTRPNHAYLEANGLDKTGVYRADDPTIIRFWSPWEWRCRCVCFPIQLEAAARYGVKEAIEWMRTGIPPTAPQWVDPPPFDLPKGWVPASAGLAA